MAARKFAELVKERSNGRIEVQVFSNGTLYKDVEELDALNKRRCPINCSGHFEVDRFGS